MKNIVAVKSYVFAIRVINAYRFLCEEKKEFVLSKQLLRSGTAIGTLIKEAKHAESKVNFQHKMNIALKEANETEYWLMLLKDTGYMDEKEYSSICSDCKEIIRVLISIIKNIKEHLIQLK